MPRLFLIKDDVYEDRMNNVDEFWNFWSNDEMMITKLENPNVFQLLHYSLHYNYFN